MPQGDAPPTLELAPGFKAPMPTEYASMKEHIETALPAESPIMYGMHTNAELSLLTSQVTTLCLCYLSAINLLAAGALALNSRSCVMEDYRLTCPAFTLCGMSQLRRAVHHHSSADPPIQC